MKEKSLVNAVIVWIDNLPPEKIASLTVSGLARKFDVDPTYLSRSFHKYNYYSLGRYLENCRFFTFHSLAMRMRNPQLKKILKIMNIRNTSHFIRRFKRYFSTTPGQWCMKERKDNKKSGRRYYSLDDLEN